VIDAFARQRLREAQGTRGGLFGAVEQLCSSRWSILSGRMHPRPRRASVHLRRADRPAALVEPGARLSSFRRGTRPICANDESLSSVVLGGQLKRQARAIELPGRRVARPSHRAGLVLLISLTDIP
jgi:hypothetical protein